MRPHDESWDGAGRDTPGAIAGMRPRLRASVFFTEDKGGRALVTDGAEVLVLDGRSTFAWLERIAPYLDGAFTVGQLTGKLPPARRQMVEGLVAALHDAQMVRDVSADKPHGLTADELDAYAAEIAFVEAFRDSPASNFERYRTSRTLVVGSGQCLVALVQALLVSGVREVSVAVTPECPTDLDELSALRAPAAERDRSQRMDWQLADVADEATLPDGVLALISEADAVLHISDRPMPARATAVERASAGRVVVQAYLTGEMAWIGPIGSPERPAASGSSVRHRLRTGGTDVELPVPGDVLTGPVPGIIANHTAFVYFEFLTGVAAEADPNRVVRIDLETLETRVHHVTPHPAGTPTPAVPGETPESIGDIDEICARLDSITDDSLGVLRTTGATDDVQLPLRVARAVAADPAGARPGALLTAWGAAAEPGQARALAGLRVAALCAWRTVDPRRLVTGRGSDVAMARGVSLSDGAERLVPAGEVFAFSRSGAPPADSVPVGVAAGASRDQAIDAALLAHCERIALSRAGNGPATRPPVDISAADLDDEAVRYRDLLIAADHPVAVHDLTDLVDLPAYAIRDGSGGYLCRAGADRATALRAILREALLGYQAVASGQSAYACGPRIAAAVSDAGAPARDRILAMLRADGHDPVVVPLDHDPGLRRALPHLLHVVLLGGPGSS